MSLDLGSGDVVVPLTQIASVYQAEQLSAAAVGHAARWDAQVLRGAFPALDIRYGQPQDATAQSAARA